MLGIVGAIVVVAGFHMLYYDPSQKKITAMRKEIAEKDKKIKIALMKAPLVKKLKKEITELEKQLNTFRVKVATSGEIIPLVKTIEDEAQRLDLKVINMSTSVHKPPPPPKPKEGDSKSKEQVSKVQTPTYIRVSFDIDIQGNYDKVEDFIKTLHNLETFIVIEKLNIVSDEKLYPRLESKVVMNVFTKKEVDNSNIDK